MTALVEGRQLLETVVASTIAGVGVTFVFSIAIWGVAQFVEQSRNERMLAAGAAGLVAALAMLATAGAVLVGILVMTSK
jgi:hypothetical protein